MMLLLSIKVVFTFIIVIVTGESVLAQRIRINNPDIRVRLNHSDSQRGPGWQTLKLRGRKNSYVRCGLKVYRGKRLVKSKKNLIVSTKSWKWISIRRWSGRLSVEVSRCEFVRPTKKKPYVVPTENELLSHIEGSLRFLLEKQVKATQGTKRFAGEWPCYMVNRRDMPFLPKEGYAVYDSNLFTTVGIYNMLGELYLKYVQSPMILSMLKQASKYFVLFEDNGEFNFWPLIPLPEKFLTSKEKGAPPLMRSPNHYKYDRRGLYEISNVFNDADDTAMAYLALAYQSEISELSPGFPRPSHLPEKIGWAFERFRDSNRKNRHSYDVLNNRPKNTGAFLTWLGQEQPPGLDGLFPKYGEPNIPFGANDVDCVVNTNVLSALAKYGELHSTQGVRRACKYINESVKNKYYPMCGTYYPNKYTLALTLANALEQGAVCLEPSRNKLVQDIVTNQNTDGTWHTYNVNDDVVQTTANALNALLMLSDKNDPVVKEVILRGVEVLLLKARRKNGKYSWSGGIFFSGGTFVKDRLVWKSESFTTALILKALVQVHEYYY